ncbi:DUF4224 domain-containing protein [Variovorax terrae]|uniref:DUF4224 domain-containing protein n=1 Tax=Variovorax terrae TaxID=2923278 RepID=A0A9X2AQ44_9BURK|nr:DUF4224 domain-containing protein [Variovorax terrae]MCJ0764152.1 DUF4224 domain-containing protein [Variovorax terrae]
MIAAASPPQSEFLAATELRDLTGFARSTAQIAWLQVKGVPHRADGRRVIVSRVLVREWLQGRQAVTSKGPNWSSVK